MLIIKSSRANLLNGISSSAPICLSSTGAFLPLIFAQQRGIKLARAPILHLRHVAHSLGLRVFLIYFVAIIAITPGHFFVQLGRPPIICTLALKEVRDGAHCVPCPFLMCDANEFKLCFFSELKRANGARRFGRPTPRCQNHNCSLQARTPNRSGKNCRPKST